MLEDVCPRCGRRDAAERAGEVGRFGRGLVEEAETGEGGQTEGPELLLGEREVGQETEEDGIHMIHAFNTRDRSSGSAWTIRSRAIRASARQLFVIYGGIR